MPNLKVGTKFAVEFRLDDKKETLIKKDVIVKNMSDLFIGAKFCSLGPHASNDKAIGFYLLWQENSLLP